MLLLNSCYKECTPDSVALNFEVILKKTFFSALTKKNIQYINIYKSHLNIHLVNNSMLAPLSYLLITLTFSAS